MENMLLYIIIGIFVLLIIYSIFNNQQSPRTTSDPENRDFRQRGDERPQYDDPGITGGGSFGRDGTSRNPVVADWERRNRDNDTSQRSKPKVSRDVDDNKVTGRGGFGRDKE